MRRYQGGMSFGPEPTAADLAAAFGLSRTGPGNYNGPCPLCSGNDRFQYDSGQGVKATPVSTRHESSVRRKSLETLKGF